MTPGNTRRRRVRRIVVRVAVFLLLGAVVNVAVAWGCSYFATPVYVGPQVVRASAFWPRDLAQEYGEDKTYGGSLWSCFGVDEADVFVDWPRFDEKESDPLSPDEIANQADSIYEENTLYATSDLERAQMMLAIREQLAEARGAYTLELQIRAGWPLRAVQGWVMSKGATNGTTTTEPWSLHVDGYAIAVTRPSIPNALARGLPYHPIWLGFAINTSFYAAILWLLFAAAGTVRRWRRIRRRLCVKCAYPVGPSQVCTECGAAAKPTGV